MTASPSRIARGRFGLTVPACFEALTGNADVAFEHIARALELGPPRVRQLAADGDDFAALGSDPRWQQLLG